MGQRMGAPVTTKVMERVCSTDEGHNPCVRAGVASMMGWRSQMEDRYFISMRDDHAVLAVFDGHGGQECSEFLARRVAEEVHCSMTDDELTSLALRLDGEFLRKSTSSGAESGSTGTVCLISQCPPAAAAPATAASASASATVSTCGDFDSAPTTPASTVSAAVFEPPPTYRVRISHVGDCRLTLCRQRCGALAPSPFRSLPRSGTTPPAPDGDIIDLYTLTADHMPSHESERKRVTAAGGVVSNNRVNGTLATSRSFGDARYKKGGCDARTHQVVAVPDIVTFEACAKDDMLIVCSDGVFESADSGAAPFDDVTLTSFVYEELRHNGYSLAAAASAVCDEALRRGSEDNITCLIARVGDDSRSKRSLSALRREYGSLSAMPPEALASFALYDAASASQVASPDASMTFSEVVSPLGLLSPRGGCGGGAVSDSSLRQSETSLPASPCSYNCSSSPRGSPRYQQQPHPHLHDTTSPSSPPYSPSAVAAAAAAAAQQNRLRGGSLPPFGPAAPERGRTSSLPPRAPAPHPAHRTTLSGRAAPAVPPVGGSSSKVRRIRTVKPGPVTLPMCSTYMEAYAAAAKTGGISVAEAIERRFSQVRRAWPAASSSSSAAAAAAEAREAKAAAEEAEFARIVPATLRAAPRKERVAFFARWLEATREAAELRERADEERRQERLEAGLLPSDSDDDSDPGLLFAYHTGDGVESIDDDEEACRPATRPRSHGGAAPPAVDRRCGGGGGGGGGPYVAYPRLGDAERAEICRVAGGAAGGGAGAGGGGGGGGGGGDEEKGEAWWGVLEALETELGVTPVSEDLVPPASSSSGSAALSTESCSLTASSAAAAPSSTTMAAPPAALAAGVAGAGAGSAAGARVGERRVSVGGAGGVCVGGGDGGGGGGDGSGEDDGLRRACQDMLDDSDSEDDLLNHCVT